MTDVDLDLPLVYSGKVRRMYALPDGELAGRAPGRFLMVATDAISAYDHVLATPIPDKGAVLTQLSLWWFDQLADLIPNHVVSTDVPDAVRGRAVVTERLDMVPVECVARGYLTGSGWAEYSRSGTVCGIELPAGLTDGARLPEPIFTPAIKAPLGEHDENVSFERIVELHGAEAADELRARTLALYARAEEIARGRGIILADTKFEFGRRPDGTLVLADEVLTPDSSRFWDAADWRPATADAPAHLPSFDKQYVRDWLTRDSGWDKASDTPPPPLPDEVVAATRARYVEAYERLTGQPFEAASDVEAVEDPWADLPTEVVPHVAPANLLVGGAVPAHQVGGLAASVAAGGSVRWRVGVVTFAGPSVDREVARALRLVGAEPVPLPADSPDLRGVSAVVLVGSRPADAGLDPLMAEVVAAAGRGLPVLGIGDGFGLLCRAGLLPGGLAPHAGGAFVCRDQRLRVESIDTVWTCEFAPRQEVTLVLRSGEGAYVADADTLTALEETNRVVLRYVGDPTGSANAIAGITNEKGNVVGLVPHPENAVEELTGPSLDGRTLFSSMLTYLAALD